ncbi:hypothetical protein GC170_08870 [bacterium]|nr:hypothetical protein [bacterium]
MNARISAFVSMSMLASVWAIAQDGGQSQPRRKVPRPSLATELHHSTEIESPFSPNPLHDHPEFFPPVEDNPRDEEYHPGAAKSIVRHQPIPMRTDDNSYGFRNPGHLARVAEYYAPRDQFDTPPHDPIHPATYNEQISAYSRATQLSAEQVGIARYNSIQNSINAYARPMGGFGFGFGMF